MMTLRLKTRSCGGYALLLTVILLAIASAGMAAVARRSYAAILEAGRVERSAQRAWLVYSLQQILPEVDGLLSGDIENDVPQRGWINLTFELGHHEVSLRISDEQAKANVNSLWEREDPAVFSVSLRDLQPQMGRGLDTSDARAATAFKQRVLDVKEELPPFLSFEQLWGAAPIRTLATAGMENAGPFDHVTLWGNGRIRVDRAEQPALRAMLSPLLSNGQVDRLIDHVAQADDRPVPTATSDLTEVLDLTDRQSSILPDRLTDESEWFSALLRMDDGLRTRATLLVQRTGDENENARPVRFDW